MSDINVKDIRKRAELLGVRPQDLLNEYNINERQKIKNAAIISDFEEKVAVLLKNKTLAKLRKWTNPFVKEIISRRRDQISLIKKTLIITLPATIVMLLFFLYLIWNESVTFFEIFFISIITLAILIFNWILCKIIYDDVTVEKKSPQRYVIEEMVKIIELIEKQEKY